MPMKWRPHILILLVLAAFAALGTAGCASDPARDTISTREAPTAIGPYSQAVRFGNLLFLSGQIPLDPKTNLLISGSIESQTQQVLENLRAVLAANGMTPEDVVSTTVYLKDLKDFVAMNAVYATFFKAKPPARATVEVSRLPRDVLVEISAIAAK
jgi:2-iminobutanoate/2-iminopropanoate deaminase